MWATTIETLKRSGAARCRFLSYMCKGNILIPCLRYCSDILYKVMLRESALRDLAELRDYLKTVMSRGWETICDTSAQ